jgi:hypothetical protein
LKDDIGPAKGARHKRTRLSDSPLAIHQAALRLPFRRCLKFMNPLSKARRYGALLQLGISFVR